MPEVRMHVLKYLSKAYRGLQSYVYRTMTILLLSQTLNSLNSTAHTLL